MKRIRIKQVDVFTSTPLAGNAAGVITEADDLTDEEMQKIAREMNLSETAFVLRPTEKADFRVRFFTPERELGLAGHPTIAAFHALAEEARIFLREPVTTVFQQTKAGVLPVEFHIKKGRAKKIMMTQVKPTFRPFKDPLEKLAGVLGVDVDEVKGTNLPVEIVSTGLPQLMVPVGSLSAVQEMRPDFSALRRFNEEAGVVSTHVFALQTLSPIAMVHTRNFSPAVGIFEDPATGTANGALGAYLIKNRVIRGNSPVTIISEQGYEINRPSEVLVEVHFAGDRVETVKVGGQAVTVMEGEMFF